MFSFRWCQPLWLTSMQYWIMELPNTQAGGIVQSMAEPKLPQDVDYRGIRWSSDDPKLSADYGNQLTDGTRTLVAVAEYRLAKYWGLHIAWDEDVPPGGPGHIWIYPEWEENPGDCEGGIPSGVVRSVPLRHARWVLSQAWAQQQLSKRVAPYLSEAYEYDYQWARLAYACGLIHALEKRGLHRP